MEDETEEIIKLRAEMAKTQRKGAYFYLVLIGTVIMAAGSSTFVSVILNHRSERKLCAVVINADEGYKRVSPPSPAGKEQARNIAELRRTLGCPT